MGRLPARSGRQRGYALLLLMIIAGSAVVYLFGRGQSVRMAGVGRSETTARALKQAREALIAYAITYGDSHGGETWGYLPLPDMGGSVDNINKRKEGWAASSFAGNARDTSLVGRLPWYSLRLPPLKDEYGECLWYAVSGSFKQNPKTDYMNWDTLGYLDLRTPDASASLWVGSVHDRPLAVIFSAGPPLAGQNRANSTATDDSVSQCGGNYDARNYLESYGANANRYVGSLHDAIDGVANSLKLLLAGPALGEGAQVLNDRAVFITPADIFVPVSRRRDFTDFINNTVIPGALACVPPQTSVARKGKATEVCGTHPANLPAAKWWDQFFFLNCAAGSSCLTVNGQACSAALIFGGERAAGQTRSVEGRSNPANYLEETLVAYQGFGGGPTVLSGAISYPGSPVSRDVVRCVH